MASVNKVILLGNLGRDPETRYLPSGSAVTNVTLATTRRYKDKSGEMQEETEWHRVTFFDRLAEVAGQYLRKGRPVYVEGRIKTRKYTDKDGIEKYATDIVATEMQLLGGRDGEGGADEAAPRAARPVPVGGTPQRAPVAATSAPPTGFDQLDDDIPF